MKIIKFIKVNSRTCKNKNNKTPKCLKYKLDLALCVVRILPKNKPFKISTNLNSNFRIKNKLLILYFLINLNYSKISLKTDRFQSTEFSSMPKQISNKLSLYSIIMKFSKISTVYLTHWILRRILWHFCSKKISLLLQL